MFADSCSAVTLYEKIDSPNTLAMGSSSFDEKSYSHGKDKNLLLPKTDRFSLKTYKFLNGKYKTNSKLTMADLFKEFNPDEMDCHAKIVNKLVPFKHET